jgi:hypothetical protein
VSFGDWLPERVQERASVSAGGEHAWRPADVPAVIEAARLAGLAVKGIQPRFECEHNSGKPYWVKLDAPVREEREEWQAYVDRAANRARAFLEEKCQPDLLREAATGFRWVRTLAEKRDCDALEFVWIVVWFQSERGEAVGVVDRPISAPVVPDADSIPAVRWLTTGWRVLLYFCLIPSLPLGAAAAIASAGGPIDPLSKVFLVYFVLSPWINTALVVVLWMPGSAIRGLPRVLLSAWNLIPFVFFTYKGVT